MWVNRRGKIASFSGAGRGAGKAPRGDLADILSAHIRRVGAEKLVGATRQAPDWLEMLQREVQRYPYRPEQVAPFPPITDLIQMFPYLTQRRGYRGGSPGPRYF